MKTIADAIYSLFIAQVNSQYSTFHTAIGGRMYYVKAPQNVGFPYVVFNIISDTPNYYFTETMVDTRIQFDLVAKSVTEIEDITTKLELALNWKKLTISGQNPLAFKRVLVSEILSVEQDIFMRAIDFIATVQR